MSVAHSVNPVKAEKTYLMYFVAKNLGQQSNYKPLSIKITYPKENQPPYFTKPLPDLWSLTVYEDDQLLGLIRQPIVTVPLPRINDLEKNIPRADVVNIDAPTGYNCGCVRVKQNFTLGTQMWIEIDQTKLRVTDQGTYTILIILVDDMEHISHMRNPYTFSIKIFYYASPDPKSRERII